MRVRARSMRRGLSNQVGALPDINSRTILTLSNPHDRSCFSGWRMACARLISLSSRLQRVQSCTVRQSHHFKGRPYLESSQV